VPFHLFSSCWFKIFRLKHLCYGQYYWTLIHLSNKIYCWVLLVVHQMTPCDAYFHAMALDLCKSGGFLLLVHMLLFTSSWYVMLELWHGQQLQSWEEIMPVREVIQKVSGAWTLNDGRTDCQGHVSGLR
jgi:hypothetical protein